VQPARVDSFALPYPLIGCSAGVGKPILKSSGNATVFLSNQSQKVDTFAGELNVNSQTSFNKVSNSRVRQQNVHAV